MSQADAAEKGDNKTILNFLKISYDDPLLEPLQIKKLFSDCDLQMKAMRNNFTIPQIWSALDRES